MVKLKKGDKAPDFTGVDQNGDIIRLMDYKGKKVVLYFYPKDDTPGCTEEACNLRDNYNDLIKHGYSVIGVSADDMKSHQKFVIKFSLPFPLVSDTDKMIINDYGVWGRKKFMGREFDGIIRTTFIIDEKGVITEIIENVNTKDHTHQITGC